MRDSKTLDIFPVPTRTEAGEKKKLDTARDQARLRFDPFLPYFDTEDTEKYWVDVEVPYQQYYAYEEILAIFGDRPVGRNTILAAAEQLTSFLTSGAISRLDPIEESTRKKVLNQFEWTAQEHHTSEYDLRQSRKKSKDHSRQRWGRVVICYSHKDAEFLEAFRVHLNPWEDEDLLELWSDKKIQLNQDWHQEIQQTLESIAVAVLLVSPNFLASDYIRQYELPLLLRHCEEGHIALACLYLRHSVVADDTAATEVELSSGQHVSIKLTKYRGFNSPQDVVAALDHNGRDKLYAKVSSNLRNLVDHQVRKTARPPSNRHFELIVQLELQSDKLVRSYFYNGDRFFQNRSSWQWPNEQETGQALFETLFGPQDQYTEVLYLLFGSHAPPIRHPVRVRIQTSDPKLSELPWVYTTWEENLLFHQGWTFELIATPPQDAVGDFPDILLKAPCPVLMVAPGTGSDTLSHHRALEERLKQAWPFYHEPPQLVGSWEALENAWQRRRPRIVYYYGPAEYDGETLHLLLDTDQGDIDKRPAPDLSQIWGSDLPRIVFFNFVGDQVSTGTALSGLRAPLIITQNGTDPSEARRTALEWFHSVLEGGEETDPIWAPHQHGLRNAVAWGAYGTWRTRTANEPAKDTIARLLLDRKAQRALGQDAVNELVFSSDRRLCCVLAYGTQGNLVELFAEQLFEHLRRNVKEVAQVYRIPMRLPTTQSFDVAKVAFEMRRALGLGDKESLRAALSAGIPRSPGRARPVLLIDWGVRGTTQDNRLSITALEAWLAFCCQQLSAECPKDMRLLSCLSVQVAKERHDTLEQAVKSLRAETRFRDRAFRLELLPPLEGIGAKDLADFLDGRGNSSCPDDLISLMPDLIVKKTDGQFSDTVNLVEQAERIGWYTVYDELNAELGQSQRSLADRDELL